MSTIADFIPANLIAWLQYLHELPDEPGPTKLRETTRRKCAGLTARYALVLLATQAHRDRYAATPTGPQIKAIVGREVHTSTWLELREKGWLVKVAPLKGSKRARYSIPQDRMKILREIETDLMSMIERLKAKEIGQ